MLGQSSITKSKNVHLSIIFWLSLTIFAYFSVQYLLSELRYKQAKKKAESQFPNIESVIYETKQGNKIDENSSQKQPKLDDSPINLGEVLLKQQLQISQLQNDYNALRLDLLRIKLSDNLPKIILGFVKLNDMVDLKMDYSKELQKLELLCRADQNLISKIEQLKLVLQKQPKNRRELFEEFNDLIPKIIEKEKVGDNGNSFVDKIKANIAQFVAIRRVGEVSKSNLEMSLMHTLDAINRDNYREAMPRLNSIDNKYQGWLSVAKSDLENAANLQIIVGDIYRYLEALSNDRAQYR